MGFPTKVQLISRKASEQYYINFPSALARAMEFSKGETVEWIVADKGNLILSRKDGADLLLRVMVIAPLGYRLRKGSKLLYRQPAYLICTDPDLPLEKLLQYYLWRWGIEVNFRDEKTLIGTGDAHVRTAASNQHLPAVTVAAYAMLWTAVDRGLASAFRWREPSRLGTAEMAQGPGRRRNPALHR